MRILDEVPSPLGLALFQACRDVLLWALAAPAERGALFAEALDGRPAPPWYVDPAGEKEIAAPLAVFGALVERPGAAQRGKIAAACSEVAGWASIRGYGATEAEFARLAAVVSPKDPELAFAAGRSARRLARYESAAEWFGRAIGLARRAGNEAAYATAYLGWGLMEEQRGRRERARSRFVRAWRAGQRGGLRTLAAAARHNLIALSVPDRPFDEGQAHVIAAYKLYGRGNPALARLAADTACFWTWHGYHSAALPLFEAALPLIDRVPDRLQVLANIGRAAAATGRADRFREVWEEVGAVMDRGGEFVPWVLIDLAHGAHTLGQRRLALHLADEAVRQAGSRGQAGASEAASAIHQTAREAGPGDADRVPPESIPPFAGRFITRLRALSDAAPSP
jgi:tetratricopeptide (TPR) repeat protein